MSGPDGTVPRRPVGPVVSGPARTYRRAGYGCRKPGNGASTSPDLADRRRGGPGGLDIIAVGHFFRLRKDLKRRITGKRDPTPASRSGIPPSPRDLLLRHGYNF